MKCENNKSKCFCDKERGHKGLHECKCEGSWDNKGVPHSFPNMKYWGGLLPLTKRQEELLNKLNK